MSREFLTATCRKRGFVGAVPLLSVPADIRSTDSALEPGMMSGTCMAVWGPMPKGFLFTWMAKALSVTCEEFERVMSSLIWPASRTSEDMTPKPVWPPWPAWLELRTGIFGADLGAAEPPEPPNGSPPPSRSRRSSAPPPPGAPLRGPLSSSFSISLRLCALSSSSNSSSSAGSPSCTGALVAMRVTNSSDGLWYTLLMSARSEISRSRRPFSRICESSLMEGLSPSTTCFVASGFVERRRQ
mmetsp:Transcript_29507/g.78080  ORF Transcript_29507/g.78080 Transcript_29507/m.78080 type:complete len:242 (+) Transcript_29507:497-1222(+)